jgi:hypothetical protein
LRRLSRRIRDSAVSVTTSLKEGHPVAEIDLVDGEEFKTASEKLDSQGGKYESHSPCRV